MKRVTASKQREPLAGLKTLAAILNFDWDGGDAGQLEKSINVIRPRYFMWIVSDGLKDRKRAKSVQEQLKADLLPILSPEGKVDPEKAYFRIMKLLRKLNEIESKTEWRIEPIDYEWLPVVGSEAEPSDYALCPLPPDEVESKDVPFSPTAELNLLGYRWHIGSTLAAQTANDFGFSQRTLYEIVLDEFKSGSIERLRTCPQCKTFFVAEDARQQFCSDEHRNEFNNKQRLSSGWF